MDKVDWLERTRKSINVPIQTSLVNFGDKTFAYCNLVRNLVQFFPVKGNLLESQEYLLPKGQSKYFVQVKSS